MIGIDKIPIWSDIMMHNNLDEIQTFLKSIKNPFKIPGVEMFSTQYKYLMYHLYITSIATIDQLIEVADLEKYQITSALDYGIKLGYIDSIAFSYYGVPTCYYVLTYNGRQKIYQILESFIDEVKSFNFKSNIKHTLEATELYYSVFKDAYDIKVSREASKFLGDSEIVRTDLDLVINYGEFSDEFFVEHDRGTERINIILDKLNGSYGPYMTCGMPVNIVFTVSKEDLLDRKKSLTVANKSKELSAIRNCLRKTRTIMNKLKIETTFDLKQRFIIYRNIKDISKAAEYVLFSENEREIIKFLEINEELKLTNKQEVNQKYHEANSIKNEVYYNDIRDLIYKYEIARVKKVKDSILETTPNVEIDQNVFTKFLSFLKDHVTHEAGKIYVPGIKEQLLRNEFIIGTLHDIKSYFSQRVRNIEDVKDYFQVLFDVVGNQFVYEEIIFEIDGVSIRKNINSAHMIINNLNVALVILEPSINLADYLKLKLLKKGTVTHKFDRLLFVTLDNHEVIDNFEF